MLARSWRRVICLARAATALDTCSRHFGSTRHDRHGYRDLCAEALTTLDQRHDQGGNLYSMTFISSILHTQPRRGHDHQCSDYRATVGFAPSFAV
ncbi:MAG: hypothetical protein J3Q66DRAFT_358010 [Benniella sp.]|nr:MAG: hypothetical protein J3Q66DRAFT_358010 [Benniella sp.]